MTQREKTNILPTLKVEDGFKGIAKATIQKVKDLETTYGEKVVIDIRNLKDNKEYSVFLNDESKNNLIDGYGKDDSDWLNKEIKLDVVKDKNYSKDKILITVLKDEKVK